jgi:hypothetical protein
VARQRVAEVAATLPEDMNLRINFDGSVFVNAAINEVFITLGIAVLLVVGVIYVFLGNFKRDPHSRRHRSDLADRSVHGALWRWACRSTC